MGPELLQHPLSRADGSAVFSDGLYTIIAGVNGPVEVNRRDELPEEAAVEVHLRPFSGVGGPRERWLETVIQSVLRSIILVHMHPRTMIQITLQVTKEPATKLRRTASDIAILPALLNASFAALVDGGLPLAKTMIATLSMMSKNGDICVEVKEKDLLDFGSIHAMAYNQHGEQVMSQYAGLFDINTLDKVADAARSVCAAAIAPEAEDDTVVNGRADGEAWLRQALHDEAKASSAWRGKT